MADQSSVPNSSSTGSSPAPNSQSAAFQASPSGGVVATLRPGQTSFAGEIRNESQRQTGAVDIDRVRQTPSSSPSTNTDPVVMPTSASEPVASQTTPPPTPTTDPTKQPQAPRSVRNLKVGAEKPSRPTPNWLLWLVVGGLILIAGGVVFFYFRERRQNQPTPEPTVTDTTVLNYWGLWEKNATLTQILRDFEAQNPGVSVDYTEKDITGYRAELQQALQTGNGPDVFRYHASWRPMLANQLATLPSSLMTTTEFNNAFYPVAATQLEDSSGRVQGVPLMYDSLELIYNKDLFAAAGITRLPRTWTDFRQTALDLTIMYSDGYIEQAGAAFGLANNVDFYSDIFGLLALQSGLDPHNPNSSKLAEVLTYYTQFYSEPEWRVWDQSFDNSTLAFARGEVAMIFGPSWLIHDLENLNPNLNIGVASVPQLDEDHPVEWATYYAEGVNALTPRSLAAWKLVQYLSSEPVLEQLYLSQSNQRQFGELYPRRDMADMLADNELVWPYLTGAGQADNFPINDRTYDDGLNQANLNALSQAIAAVAANPNQASKQGEALAEAWAENSASFGY